MALLPIRLLPDPVLRVECAEVRRFDASLRKLAEDMTETMYAAPGVGLAAPQVGVDMRLAVVDVCAADEESDLRVLVNPRITSRQGQCQELEGCLSIPGFSEKVTRAAAISVAARGLDGEPIEFEAEGWLARAVCHEIDHLDGVLFLDHLRGLRRERAKRFLRRLEQEEVALA